MSQDLGARWLSRTTRGPIIDLAECGLGHDRVPPPLGKEHQYDTLVAKIRPGLKCLKQKRADRGGPARW
jgi:hypothetical protein